MNNQRAKVNPARYRIVDAQSVPKSEQLAEQDDGMPLREFVDMLRRHYV